MKSLPSILRVLLLGVALCLAGCLANDDSMITTHRWRLISANPDAPWTGTRTRLYTYVLAGDIGTGNANDATRVAREALAQALMQVQASSPMDTNMPSSRVAMMSNVNQFLVPANDASGRLELANFNVGLSSEMVRRFSAALRQTPAIREKLMHLGPFLIATKKPLQEVVSQDTEGHLAVASDEPLLLLDMSGAAPPAIPVYVNAFKEAVRSSFVETRELGSVRADLASLLINVQGAVPRIVSATAHAGQLLLGAPGK